MVTSSLVLMLTMIAFVLYEWAALRRSLSERIGTLGRVVADNCAAPLAFANKGDAQEVLSALQVDPYIRVAALYDREGKVFVRFPVDAPLEAIPPRPGATGSRFEPGALVLFEPVIQAGSQLGTLYIRTDQAAIYARFSGFGLIALGVAAASLLVALVLSNGLQRRISTPVLALADTARTITERNDYSVRTTKQAGGEIGLLTDAFNRMLEEIEGREASLCQAQEDLKESHGELERRVDERTAELEAFTYSVSHDLRAPLRHVMSYAKMLNKHAGPHLDEKGRRYTQIIIESGRRMESLIDDLLNLSKIGRTPLNETEVDLHDLVKDALQELAPDMHGRPIEWQIGKLRKVLGDPTLLRAVMINLLSNAIKYTRGRNPALIAIDCEDKDGEMVCSVRDNGAGFDMKFVDKLFGVFQRLHRLEDFEGSGIGLASVRRIIQRHGGRTWAEGKVDHGATFYFSFPAKRAIL